MPDYAYLFSRVGATNEAVLERKLRAASLRYIREHPTYVAKVAWWNTRRMLDLGGLRRSRSTAATITIDHYWADRGLLCFWIFAALALAGAFTAMARRVPWYVWAVPVLKYLERRLPRRGDPALPHADRSLPGAPRHGGARHRRAVRTAPLAKGRAPSPACVRVADVHAPPARQSHGPDSPRRRRQSPTPLRSGHEGRCHERHRVPSL